MNVLRTKKLDESYYPQILNNWDDQIFRDKILKYLNSNLDILDIGAGVGIVKAMNFKGLVNKVTGIDPDPRVMQNPFLDEAIIGYGDQMVFDDNYFDIVISDNVFEHIYDPEKFLKEVYRVLKPGGYLISKSPNKYYYVSLIAKVTPHFLHEKVNKKRGRKDEDTFPTYYKINTKKAQLKYALNSGFKLIEFEAHEGRPEYLRHFGPLYYLGIAYERFVNKLKFNKLKAINISVFKK